MKKSKLINVIDLEELELIAADTRKEIRYNKYIGDWSWSNRGEETWYGGFPTRYDALYDAVEPYLQDADS